MQAPDLYQFSKGHHTPSGYEITVGLSPYGNARFHASVIFLRLAALALAPFKIDLELKA